MHSLVFVGLIEIRGSIIESQTREKEKRNEKGAAFCKEGTGGTSGTWRNGCQDFCDIVPH